MTTFNPLLVGPQPQTDLANPNPLQVGATTNITPTPAIPVGPVAPVPQLLTNIPVLSPRNNANQQQLLQSLQQQRDQLQQQVNAQNQPPAPAPTSFKTPSGAQVDAQGNLISGPVPPEAPPASAQPEVPSFDTILSQSGLNAGSLEEVIKNVSAAYGIDSNTKEISALDNAFIDKSAEINNNPWLSEGIRADMVKKEQGKYEQKKNALIDNLKLKQDVVGKAIDLFYKERDLKKDILFKQLDVRQKQIDAEKIKTTPDIINYEYAVAHGFTGTPMDYERQQANLKATIAGTGGLTPGQIQTAITSIANQFDNEPVVKNFNVVAEGAQFASSIANKANPTSADDQGLIYAFAKAMDPNSAVREGEYTTVQKYAQSFIQTGWANAKRLASNVAFLTPEARANMLSTINSRYEASRKNYQNVYNEYNRRLEDAKSGKVGGSLTNYGSAFNPVINTGEIEPSKGAIDYVKSLNLSKK